MTRPSSLKLSIVLAVLLPALCLWGCGDDDDDNPAGPDPITIADFAGTWIATAFTITDNTNAQNVLDLILAGGSVSMTADESGNLTGQGVIPDPQSGTLMNLPIAGHFELVGQDSVATVFTPEIPPIFTSFTSKFTMTDNTMALLDEDTEFDFDGDEVMEICTFAATMAKQ